MTQARELLACPFCGSVDHLYLRAAGSLTRDMPARPYRYVCVHIDHDEVMGPVAYGEAAALTAWNTRPALSMGKLEWRGDKLFLTLNGGTLEFGHVHQVDARSSYDRSMGPPCVGNWHIHINHVRGIDVRSAFATEAEARAALEQAARQWFNLPPIKEG